VEFDRVTWPGFAARPDSGQLRGVAALPGTEGAGGSSAAPL